MIELRDDRHPGLVGIGEGYPDRFYGETPATVRPKHRRRGRRAGADRRGLGRRRRDGPGDRPQRRRKALLDIALHDLAGKVAGVLVHELPASRPSCCRPTSRSIDEPAVLAERASRASRFPALKIKVGGAADIETIRAVRGVYDGPIRVDANTAWRLDEAVACCPSSSTSAWS